MSAYFAHYWPGLSGLATLGAAILVWLGCGLLGNALTRASRLRGEDVLSGFGVAGALLTVLHILFHPPLTFVAAGLAVAAMACGLWRARALARSRLWRPLLLMAPALIVAAGVPLDEWDSFSHWGLNAAWIWRHGVLPWPGLGSPPSSNPDYPYGYPFLMYLVGLARGGYAENAGAVLNAVLLVPAADMLGRACAAFDARRLLAHRWLYPAVGAFLCLPLQPWFQRSTTLAAYADTLMAVGLLAFALSARRSFLGGGARHKSRVGLELGALALALVVGKESGLLLLPVCLVAGALVALRTQGRDGIGNAVAFFAALAPALVVGGAWEWYVRGWLHSSFTILPPWSWQWGLLPALLAASLHEVAGHGLFYLVLAWALVLGAISAWRGKAGAGFLRQFAAWLIAGHLGVLFCAYLGGGFTADEVSRAASFYRYGTQVGLVALASVAAFVSGAMSAKGEPGRPGVGRYWAVVLAILILLAAPKLYAPRTSHEAMLLARGRELSELLAPDSHVGLVGWQSDPYAFFLLRYELFRPGRDDRGLTLTRIFARPPATSEQRRRLFARLASAGEYRYLLVMDQLGLQPGSGADMLLYRASGSGWQRMESWPQ